jgi:hypothetical protein
MSIGAKFPTDIFISYTRRDNVSVSGPEGWITALHNRLLQMLAERTGEQPQIWRDLRIEGNEILDATIVLKLKESAILLSVVSPLYMKSSYCREELLKFLAFAEGSGGLVADNKSRIFKVVKSHVPLEQQPECLRSQLGYAFYRYDPVKERHIEFEYEVFQHQNVLHKDLEYWSKLGDLVHGIESFLGYDNNSPKVVKPTSVAVYLSETTFDLQEARNELRRELEQHGYVILPDRPLPFDEGQLKTEVSRYLRHSKLAIHLVGAYSSEPKATSVGRPIVSLQHELGEALTHDADFSNMIWIPAGTEVKDEYQKEFVSKLKRSPLRNGEWFEGTLEDFKALVQQKLLALQKPLHKRASQRSVIYLIFARQDRDAAQQLKEYLLGQNYEVLISITHDNPQKIAEHHQQSLRNCDAVVIFYHSAGELWLMAQLQEAFRLRVLRETTFKGIAFYFAGPYPEKFALVTHFATVIRNDGEFDPAYAAEFLNKVTGREATANE